MPSYDELKIYREVRTIVVSGNFPRECFYEVSQLSKLLQALNEDRIKSDVAN